jgi:hypothetical protein
MLSNSLSQKVVLSRIDFGGLRDRANPPRPYRHATESDPELLLDHGAHVREGRDPGQLVSRSPVRAGVTVPVLP